MDLWVANTQTWVNDAYSTVPGVGQVAVDGQTGWQTVYALTRALQYELGITSLSNNFGPGTLAALEAKGPIDNDTTPTNIIRIAQGAMYCKGYDAGGGHLSGEWSSTAMSSLQDLRTDMGLSSGTGVIHAKVFKALLNMDAFSLIAGGNNVVRNIQKALNGRYLDREDYYIIPTDGYYSRDVQRALMLAIQYEIGMADGVANGNFGPGTKAGLQSQAALTLGSVDSSKFFVHLFQAALNFNGYSVAFDGDFSSLTRSAVLSFQSFVALPTNGNADLQTWASLLVSTGDPDRPGTGADCVTTLGVGELATLLQADYQYFGRYLTNTPDRSPDKCLKWGELERVLDAGGHVFPIFQTGGGTPSHFTYERGREVAEEAANAAWAYRIPENSVIYFTVDWDVVDSQVTSMIIPYFQGVNELIDFTGRTYRVGIYGPRNVCSRVSEVGLATYSFVSDMSTGYSGNLGYSLPSNWAFDQVQTLTVGSGFDAIEIDKNIVSGRDSAVSSLAPQIGVGDDPLIPSSLLDAFEEAWYGWCYSHPDSLAQQQVMLLNRNVVKGRVQQHDAFITSLASEYNVYKALILTPLIWESMVINVADDAADAAVMTYYADMEAGSPFPLGNDDSSTGPCQIFASTAIAARNFAVERGLLSDRIYDVNVWQDMWEVWKKLHGDEQFNIETAMFVMMMEAQNMASMLYTGLREMTPSDVARTLYGYNGGQIYGREKAQLYYLI